MCQFDDQHEQRSNMASAVRMQLGWQVCGYLHLLPVVQSVKHSQPEEAG